jgi:hypothetical protein
LLEIARLRLLISSDPFVKWKNIFWLEIYFPVSPKFFDPTIGSTKQKLSGK